MKLFNIIIIGFLLCLLTGCTSGCQGRQSPGNYRDTGNKTNDWSP